MQHPFRHSVINAFLCAALAVRGTGLLLLLILILGVTTVQAKSNNDEVSTESTNEIETKRQKLLDYLNSIQLSQEPKTEAGKQGIELYQQFLTGKQDALPKSVALLEKAAKQNDSEAMSWLGQLYLKGSGVELDQPKGQELLMKADSLGNASASYNLAVYLFEQTGGQGDLSKVKTLLTKARKQDYLLATSTLGDIAALTGDMKQAIAYYQQGIAKGDLHAMTTLGRLYLMGDDVPKDSQQGLELLERAWESGWHDAGIRLYSAYINGRGVQKNDAKGIAYLRAAATLGSGDANAYLCAITIDGSNGVKKDIAAAIQLCEQGTEYGSIIAPATLASIYLRHIKDPMLYPDAIKWLYYAAEKSNPTAMASIALGITDEVDIGFGKNYDEAYRWAKQSAEIGYPLGMLVYAILSLDTKHFDVSFLDGADAETCWYWSSILEVISPGRMSKGMIDYCGQRLGAEWKQQKQTEIRQKITLYESNEWVANYLQLLQGGMVNLNNKW